MKKYIIAIDQSTSASKVFLLDESAAILRRFSKPHRQYYPGGGGAEHDAEEIWQNVKEGIISVTDGIDKSSIAALSLCNQRETTVFWDKSGKPLRKAIVWQDVRSAAVCEELKGGAKRVKDVTGLDLSPYYPAGKAAFALRGDRELLSMAASGDAYIGTVDSYLIYRLTGGNSFCQDISNASRTQLFDIRNKKYDAAMCDLFGVPIIALPKVLPSDGNFGETNAQGIAGGIPITGVMGDSHASLYAQGCVKEGMTKTSYGTGSSVMMNTGKTAFSSGSGLSTSIAYGCKGETYYVLEGNITHSGDTLRWLSDEAEMVSSPAKVEETALTVEDNGGVYLVPAFSGLGAPYFDSDARAAFIGISRSTRRAHMVRAALESMAYQNADVIYSMQSDSGVPVSLLHSDGGGCKNKTLMQLQADLLGCPVEASEETELSALGSAAMALSSLGLNDKPNLGGTVLYEPKTDKAQRRQLMERWHRAVSMIRTR